MSHHIYFYKKLRLIYDQFENQSFNNYNYNVTLDNLNDLNEYIGEEYYEIIIKMYVDIIELEKEKNQKKRYNKRYYDYIKIFVRGCDKHSYFFLNPFKEITI